MKTNLVRILFSVLFLVSCGEAYRPDPASIRLLETLATEIPSESLDSVRASSIKAELDVSFDQVWSSALAVLAQYASVYKLTFNSRSSGILGFLDIDALAYDETPFLLDMPFLLLVETRSENRTTVYVYPQIERVEKASADNYSSEHVEAIRSGMTLKAQVFLDRLITQTLAKKKWDWLRTHNRR